MPAKWSSFTSLRLFLLVVLSAIGAIALYAHHNLPESVSVSDSESEGPVIVAAKTNDRKETQERKAQKKEEQQLKKEEKEATLTPSSTPRPSSSPALSPTPVPAPTPQLTPVPSANWEIRSVSSMKETKDRVCGQPPRDYIEKWVDRAKELGANYISISTPYDDPSCASALSYTRSWIEVIRSRGMSVWHRHMPLAFEGIYGVPKNNATSYLDTISNYIKNNPDLFKEGDIFTPIPEPQNGGIQGVTHCASSICQFENATDFNTWLRDAITTADTAFESIGLSNLNRIGYYGFDGFVAWGHGNPDWDGILEEETIQLMGNITIDHYPEIVNDSMENSLNELEKRYPGMPIVIGEWGVISGNNYEEQIHQSMGAAVRSTVVGFNYWHMGVGGNESLVNSSLSPLPPYFTVQSYFSNF